MKNFYFYFVIILFFATEEIAAQDFHFSQFYTSPMLFNPAFTADMDGNWRFVNNYRSQWKAISEPFKTTDLTYEKKLEIKSKTLLSGIIFLFDQSGIIGLTSTKLYVSFATNKQVGKSIFSFGIQPGFEYLTYNYNKSTFPSQFDMNSGYYNPELDANEPNLGENDVNLDLNFGMNIRFPERPSKPCFGISVMHGNFPNESFSQTKQLRQPRFVLSANFRFDYQNVFIYPDLYYSYQSSANELVGGLRGGIKLPSNYLTANAVFAGCLFRTSVVENHDAIIAVAGINFSQISVGFSYDVNISELQEATNYRGAFEFSVIFSDFSRLVNVNTFPCIRF